MLSVEYLALLPVVDEPGAVTASNGSSSFFLSGGGIGGLGLGSKPLENSSSSNPFGSSQGSRGGQGGTVPLVSILLIENREILLSNVVLWMAHALIGERLM